MRRSITKRLLVPAAIGLSLVLVPALSGCSANSLESVVEGVTGGNVDLGGASVPDDFPSEIPLYDGEIVNGLGLGTGADKVWNVIVKVPDAAAIEDIKSQLAGAGLTESFDQSAGGASGIAYTNDSHGVLVTVTEDGNNGFVATYVVSPAAK